MTSARFRDGVSKTLIELSTSPYDPKEIVEINYTQKLEAKEASAFKAALKLDVPVNKVTADRGKEPCNAQTKKAILEGNSAFGVLLDQAAEVADEINALLDEGDKVERFHQYFSYK